MDRYEYMTRRDEKDLDIVPTSYLRDKKGGIEEITAERKKYRCRHDTVM